MTMQGRFSLKKQIQIALVMLLVGYGALSLLTASHFERLANIPFIGDASSRATKGAGSTAGRESFLREGVKMVASSPLIGIGIGNFTWYYEKQSGRVGSSPHNSYLAAAVEGGLPALLLYLMLFGCTLHHFGRVERETRDPELRAIACGLRWGMIVFLFFSLFAEFWLNIMTYLLIGCAIVLKRVHEQEVLGSFSGVATGANSRVRLA
jgi:O-antigen ligase